MRNWPENLFLRKQLACYLDRQVRPHRTDNASRIALVALSRLIVWRDLLTIVRPETLVRWHRDMYRLFWHVKSRPRGRPRIPANCSNSSPTWRPPIGHRARSESRRSSG
jgi:putative transposase